MLLYSSSVILFKDELGCLCILFWFWIQIECCRDKYLLKIGCFDSSAKCLGCVSESEEIMIS